MIEKEEDALAPEPIVEDDVPLPSAVTELAPIPPKKTKRINKRFLYHPYSKKGLFRITKDGDYLYRVPKSPEKASASLKLGIFDAPSLVNSSNGASFSDLYGGNDPMLLFNYEWKKDNWMRNLSLTVGSGLIVASGKGRLQSGSNAGEESLEEFLFIMVPVNAGVSYKARIWNEQKVIPYAEAGLSLFGFNEYRNDGEPPIGRFGGAAGVYAAGGLALSVTSFDWDAAVQLDAEYGINSVWLTAEVRQTIGFTSFDMTATLFNAGVMTHF